ncbi:MAG: hypothetical protein WCT40_04070 [Candidatus Magasanikbacteria bacterium]
MARIQWRKIGEPKILKSLFGKFLANQKYLNPNNGEEEEYALFGQKDWFVTLVVTDEGRKVVTVSEYKQGRDDWGMELPAGTFQGYGPPTIDMVAANVEHETGYTGRITPLGFTWLATRGSKTRVWQFLMTGASKTGEVQLDAAEDIEVELVPLDEWIEMIQNGTITEHSAIVATTRALPHLGIRMTDRHIIEMIAGTE